MYQMKMLFMLISCLMTPPHSKKPSMLVELVEKEDSCGIEEDTQSYSTEDESLADTDYVFSDDVILKKSIVGANKELETGKKMAETIAVESQNKCRKMNKKKLAAGRAFGQQNRDDKTGDFKLYDGKNIPMHEESESINSEGRNSNSKASDDDSLKRRKSRYVKFRPEHDMVDPKFFVGLLFDDKQIFK